MKIVKIFSILLLHLFIVSLSISNAMSSEDRIKAKIGIEVQYDNERFWAKGKEIIKAGDNLKIYVIPEKRMYVYVIYSDQNKSNLFSKELTDKLILPSDDQNYNFDGASQTESFTIICSKNELKDIISLFGSNQIEKSAWRLFEKKLTEKNKFDVSENVDKPLSFAGNMRENMDKPLSFAGNVRSIKKNADINTLREYTGESIIVKNYEFTIKK